MIFPLSVSDQFGSSVAKSRRAAASVCEKSTFPIESIKKIVKLYKNLDVFCILFTLFDSFFKDCQTFDMARIRIKIEQ